ncbi:AN1-type zinc finger protein 2B [Portunus trituberculatus]|uniref:AN1-type zinc finger protein 2B n=1 Tax=Portunus trituberculatus TaxID=210409 RepID=A0A5B7GPJ4_PORTR|nr:AN1-type zinc finger protein 2B [Portunus trituberculatus]
MVSDLHLDMGKLHCILNSLMLLLLEIYTNKCSADGCKTKEMIPVLCESCRQNYCLRHRHPSDHDCKGPTSAKEQAL